MTPTSNCRTAPAQPAVRQGDRIPDATFRTRVDHEWVDVNTAAIFDNRCVVVFALPGAFTPTCSSSHVPRYHQLAPALRQHGVDEIVCIAVNDAFVMNEWQEAQQAWNVRFLPDGNGAFTAAMGMLVDKSDLGFGPRSRRYSMLVRNGIIEKLFVESEAPGDPFAVSDADTMLRYLAPNAAPPADAVIFTRRGCSHCARAKALLREAGIDYDELVLNRDFTDRTLRALSQDATYPRVFVNGEQIGGADALAAWLAQHTA